MTPRAVTATTAVATSKTAASPSNTTLYCSVVATSADNSSTTSTSTMQLSVLSISAPSSESCCEPQNKNNPMPVMISRKRPATSSMGPLLLVTRESHKRMRRIGLVQRTHSPVASPNNSSTSAKSLMKRLPPTLPGVQKAAQILQSGGVVIFPTERTYEACVRWGEPLASQLHTVAFRPQSFPSPADDQSVKDRSCAVHLYVHKSQLSQLDALIAFPKKAYALMPPSSTASPPPSSVPSSPSLTCKVFYFSETRWILHRLAQRYWPGPLVIHVPVRSGFSSTQALSSPSTSITTTAACPTTIPSLLMQQLPLSCQDSYANACRSPGTDFHNNNNNNTTFRPLSSPSPTTTRRKSSLADDYESDDSRRAACVANNFATPTKPLPTSAGTPVFFLGLRCPSHPLTARILKEAKLSTSSTLHPLQESDVNGLGTNSAATRRLQSNNSWWMGLPVQGNKEDSFLTSTNEVAQQLPIRLGAASMATPTRPNGSDPVLPTPTVATPSPVTVHVVNGEDKREVFSVPTCQQYDVLSSSSAIGCTSFQFSSIWIDDTSRTLHVFGTLAQGTSVQSSAAALLEQLLPDDVVVNNNKTNNNQCDDAKKPPYIHTRVSSCSSSSSSSGCGGAATVGQTTCGGVTATNNNRQNRILRAVLQKWKVLHYNNNNKNSAIITEVHSTDAAVNKNNNAKII